MSGRVRVSVVVPTFDGAAYLDECLGSIAAQDLRGAEVLVNDDGSTDATVELARSWQGRIEGLRVERNPDRLGAVGNVNRCLRLARGRWVKPVFQDDTIEPGALAALLAARRRGVPAVVGARTYHFEDGVPQWQRDACAHLVAESLTTRLGSGLATAAQVADAAAATVAAGQPHLNFVGEPVAVLLDRRAALRAGGFDERYAQLWDYELVVRLAMRRGLVLLDEPVASFRVHGGSETARNLAGSAFDTNVLDRLRLLVAYATARQLAPVRAAAARREPPLDLTATATGSAWAARRVAAELPPEARPGAVDRVEDLAGALPHPAPPWAGSLAASRYAVELLHELSDDVDAAVTDLYTHEPLAVDLATPEAVEPAPAEPADTARGPEPARRRPVRAVLGAAHALRANQWWNHMLGPIVAFACLQIGWRDAAPGDALPRVVALVAAAIALAAYGYVVNDTADVDADRRVGKHNSMTDLAPATRVAVVVAFAALGALPWLFVPLPGPALVVLVGLYLLPLAYSPRPLRLKERHVLGPISDASNAFLLPALFTIALFAPLGGTAGPPALMLVGAVAWAAAFGLRAIILHQVADAANDRASGTSTLVTSIGEVRAVRIVRRVLYPVEVLGLVALTATVATWAPWLVAGGVVLFGAFHAARLRGPLDRSLAVTRIENGLGMYWTQVWPALLLSLALAVHDPAYLALTGLVLLLFWPRLRAGVRNARGALGNERLRWQHRRASR